VCQIAKLALKTPHVVIDGVLIKKVSLGAATRGIPDESCGTTEQNDGSVSGHPEVHEGNQTDHVAQVDALGCRIVPTVD